MLLCFLSSLVSVLFIFLCENVLIFRFLMCLYLLFLQVIGMLQMMFLGMLYELFDGMFIVIYLLFVLSIQLWMWLIVVLVVDVVDDRLCVLMIVVLCLLMVGMNVLWFYMLLLISFSSDLFLVVVKWKFGYIVGEWLFYMVSFLIDVIGLFDLVVSCDSVWLWLRCSMVVKFFFGRFGVDFIVMYVFVFVGLLMISIFMLWFVILFSVVF